MYLTAVALHLILLKQQLYSQDKRNIYVANESFGFENKHKIQFSNGMRDEK